MITTSTTSRPYVVYLNTLRAPYRLFWTGSGNEYRDQQSAAKVFRGSKEEAAKTGVVAGGLVMFVKEEK